MGQRFNNKGETVVEVLISIAVVASVLASSYYLVTRSSKQGRAAAERSAALKTAEAKVEILRAIKATIPSTATSFCISSGGALNTDLTSTDCTADGKYKIVITKNAATYDIKTTWNGALRDNETLTLYYRP